MKAVIYTRDAARDLRKHADMAVRIRKAVEAYAADPAAHANNVTQLVGSTEKRMRAGDFRVLFDEPDADITVAKVASL